MYSTEIITKATSKFADSQTGLVKSNVKLTEVIDYLESGVHADLAIERSLQVEKEFNEELFSEMDF